MWEAYFSSSPPTQHIIVHDEVSFQWSAADVFNYSLGLTIRSPYGAVGHGGHYHSQSPEAFFCHAPGIKVCLLPFKCFGAWGLNFPLQTWNQKIETHLSDILLHESFASGISSNIGLNSRITRRQLEQKLGLYQVRNVISFIKLESSITLLKVVLLSGLWLEIVAAYLHFWKWFSVFSFTIVSAVRFSRGNRIIVLTFFLAARERPVR